MSAPLLDERGRRYGMLVVLERAESKGGRTRWRCRCDCGKEAVVHGTSLRQKHTVSCGCYGRSRRSASKDRPTWGNRFGAGERA